jgi:signal transduction histidine kinase
VVVLPPFWATWWFRGALILVLGGGLYLGMRSYVGERLRRERDRHERETAVLAERMRIAGDMHDDLGAGLSALKLKSEMALRVEKDPLKREQLGALANTAGELIGSMRQIIWTMNADQTSVEDLVVYTANYVRTYCEQNGLTPEVITGKQWPEVSLSTEQRRNIFLVVKEALHNVVKHANARTVRLVIAGGDELLVDVQDDGIGLPGHTLDSVGNGLRNMRKRIAALGGHLGMETGQVLPGDLKGTRIRFRVPLPKADGNQRSIAAAEGPPDLRPR